MENRKIKKCFGQFSLLFLLALILLAGCEKAPFDYRNKWIGEWGLNYEVYVFGDRSQDSYTEQVTIENAKDNQMGKALKINGLVFGVDKDGNLSMPQGKGQFVETVGTIDKDKLSFEVNTSIDSPGVLYTVSGTPAK